MKLYYTKRSPYARKVLIVAHELGLIDDIEVIGTNLADKPESLLTANPIGKIPTLVTKNGDTYYDSNSICTYLDSLTERSILFPQGGYDRPRIENLRALSDGLMDVTVSCFLESVRPEEIRSKTRIVRYLDTISKILNHINEKVDEYGTELNAATISLISAIGYDDFRLPHIDWRLANPQLEHWEKQFSERPSVKETVPVLS